MIRLVASDMDGTLLDEGGKLPEETFELIHELRRKGVIFAASSGRRLDTLRWLFDPVKDEMDYVASLGTQVFGDGRLLGREVFSTEGVRMLFETTQLFDCLHLALYDRTHSYLLDDQSAYIRELDKDLPGIERVYDPPAPSVNIIKAAVCCGQPKQIMDMTYVLERELGDRFTFMPSGDRWIDVTPRGIDKATGIRQLMRYYGIDADEVMAFGDSMNDYAILRFVGHPRVMSNARYGVRQISPVVIGSNAEHAVQGALRELLDELS